MVQIVPIKSKRSKGKKKVNMGLLYRKFSFAKSNNTQIPVNKILFYVISFMVILSLNSFLQIYLHSLTFQKSKSTSDVVEKARPNKVVDVINTDSALIISNGTNQEMCVPSLDQMPAYWIEF